MRANAIVFGGMIVTLNSIWQDRFASLSKFQANAECLKSQAAQRKLLNKARLAIASDRLEDARLHLDQWRVERAYHANLLVRLESPAVRLTRKIINQVGAVWA